MVFQSPPAQKLEFTNFVNHETCYEGNQTFKFLNKSFTFEKTIDWDFPLFGKLWIYQLQYFDFLHQENSKVIKPHFDQIIFEFLKQLPYSPTSKEPYPLAVRIINWVKYFSIYGIPDEKVLSGMYSQIMMLEDQIEYQHLANHLLENAFAFVFGGIFFGDRHFYWCGKKIVLKELKSQILNDGAHFELSPMYHSLVTFRLLDLLQTMERNKIKMQDLDNEAPEFIGIIRKYVFSMLDWLKSFAYKDGSIAHFNDSTNGIAPPPQQLFEYGISMGWEFKSRSLSDCGYRHLKSGDIEVIIKVGQVGPHYNVAHAHADSLSFTVFHKSIEIITDRGVSTYEKNELRQQERGTESHNTVLWKGQNSSDIWGGFRMGKKATTIISKDEKDHVIAAHNGYPIKHERSWYLSENKLIVSDILRGTNGTANLHFYPQAKIVQNRNNYHVSTLKITFEGALQVRLGTYDHCEGFNKVKKSPKLSIDFKDSLTTIIEF